MPDPSNGGSPSRSASRVLDLLDALQEAPDGLPLHELARRTDMPKSTALRYLVTLLDRRYVDRDPVTGEYRLGLGLPSQAQFHGRLTSAARPVLERIAKRFNEMTILGVLDRDRIAVLDVVQSTHVIRLDARIGSRSYLHCTSAGKAVAATLPEKVVRWILATSGMPARTSETITDVDVLLGELEQIRQRGYAIGNQENDAGARGVAVPLPSSRVHAVVGVTGPVMRFPLHEAERVGLALREEVLDITAAFDPHAARHDVA
jgi:IclR family transcriptional regulator, acetate operon repressor